MYIILNIHITFIVKTRLGFLKKRSRFRFFKIIKLLYVNEIAIENTATVRNGIFQYRKVYQSGHCCRCRFYKSSYDIRIKKLLCWPSGLLFQLDSLKMSYYTDDTILVLLRNLFSQGHKYLDIAVRCCVFDRES